jgi:DNA-binding NarL/FixJ family response regulator
VSSSSATTTVKTHLQSAFAKLGVDNTVQAGVIADRSGFPPAREPTM